GAAEAVGSHTLAASVAAPDGAWATTMTGVQKTTTVTSVRTPKAAKARLRIGSLPFTRRLFFRVCRAILLHVFTLLHMVTSSRSRLRLAMAGLEARTRVLLPGHRIEPSTPVR